MNNKLVEASFYRKEGCMLWFMYGAFFFAGYWTRTKGDWLFPLEVFLSGDRSGRILERERILKIIDEENGEWGFNDDGTPDEDVVSVKGLKMRIKQGADCEEDKPIKRNAK